MASPPVWHIKMLYDGQCPLCSREVAMLKKRNGRGFIAFEDITSPAFDPRKYGLTWPQVVGAMKAVKPDGSILSGVDVFAELYEAVGWNWLAAALRWRLTRPLTDVGYRLFAAVRPRLSTFRAGDCEAGTCAIPARRRRIVPRGTIAATSCRRHTWYRVTPRRVAPIIRRS